MADKVTEYVTPQILECVLKNGIFPQDVQHSSTIWLSFGTYGLKISRAYTRITKYKIVSNWKELTADEINKRISEEEWKIEKIYQDRIRGDY